MKTLSYLNKNKKTSYYKNTLSSMNKPKPTQKNFCNIQKIADIFEVKKFSTIKTIHEKYNRFSYESDILPTIYQYNKNFPELSKFLSRVAFLKKKDFFLPSKTEDNIKRLIELQNFLLKNTSLNIKEITEIIFCIPEIANDFPQVILKNAEFILNHLFKDNKEEIIKKYPKILTVSKQQYENIIFTFMVYFKNTGNSNQNKEDSDNINNTNNLNNKNKSSFSSSNHEDISRQEFEDLIKKNPLLLTLDVKKLAEHLEFLSELKQEVIMTSEKNIKQTKNKKLMDKEDFKKRLKLGGIVDQEVSMPIEEEMRGFKVFDFISTTPYLLLTSPTNFKEIFSIFKEKVGIDSFLALYLIKRYPDISFLNKNKLFSEKIDLLLSMVKMDRFVLKQFLKYFPFVLCKSFHSLIQKYNFFVDECKYKLNGDLEIFPMILIFDFQKEIKPKLSILRDIENFKEEKQRKQELGSFSKSKEREEREVMYEKSKLISVGRAFSISKEEFCEEVGIDVSIYDKISSTKNYDSDNPSFPVLKEKDLMFYYSRYSYV